MRLRVIHGCCVPLLLVLASVMVPCAGAATCTTQAQMTAAQRDALSTAAHTLLTRVQSGDTAGIRGDTLPAVASDFQGIASSVQALEPLVQGATITIETVYLLDASTEPANEQHTDFFCGSPVVSLTFQGLPPATYALVILHATGVKQPQ